MFCGTLWHVLTYRSRQLSLTFWFNFFHNAKLQVELFDKSCDKQPISWHDLFHPSLGFWNFSQLGLAALCMKSSMHGDPTPPSLEAEYFLLVHLQCSATNVNHSLVSCLLVVCGWWSCWPTQHNAHQSPNTHEQCLTCRSTVSTMCDRTHGFRTVV